MSRAAAILAVLLAIATAAPVLAASPVATCRRECKQTARTCKASSRDIFRSAKTDCRAAADRRSCTRTAKTSFRGWKQSCRSALRECKQCCREGGRGAGSCAGGVNDPSIICPNALGGLAVYWDWLNAVFHPLARIPTPGVGWQLYGHPGYPLLGFLHPPGWTPFTIAAEQTVGVDLIRNDGAAVWRWFGTWGDVSAGPRALRDFEVSNALAFLGNPSPVNAVCLNEAQVSPAPGIVTAASNVALEAGPFTIFVVSVVTALEGLPGGQIFFNTAVAPTSQRDALVFDVFLPIHFQLFIGNTVQDRDLDGVPDSQDNFPDDPTRA